MCSFCLMKESTLPANGHSICKIHIESVTAELPVKNEMTITRLKKKRTIQKSDPPTFLSVRPSRICARRLERGESSVTGDDISEIQNNKKIEKFFADTDAPGKTDDIVNSAHSSGRSNQVLTGFACRCSGFRFGCDCRSSWRCDNFGRSEQWRCRGNVAGRRSHCGLKLVQSKTGKICSLAWSRVGLCKRAKYSHHFYRIFIHAAYR